MRLLLDECVPRPLLRDLIGYDAPHVVDLGWSSRRNGELLKLMVAEHFEALFTVDRNLVSTELARERHCRRDSGGPHEPCEGAASAHAEGSRRPSDREGR